MPKYTNTKTGKVYNSPRALSPEELQVIFSSGESDQRSPEAQKIDRPLTSSERFSQTALHPFSSFIGGNPSGRAQAPAKVLDALFRATGLPMLEGGAKIRESLSAPNLGTGLIEAGGGLLGAVSPLLFPRTNLALSGIAQASPKTGEAIQTALRPVTSITNPQSRETKALAEAVDIALPGALVGASKLVSPKVGSGLRSAGQHIYGTALRAGENLSRIEELNKFGTERGLSMTKAGAEKAGGIETNLKPQLYEKILKPLTTNKVEVDPVVARDALVKLDSQIGEGLITGGRSFSNIVKRNIAELDKKILEHPDGKLTPLEAQKYKETANHVLDKYYQKQSQEGRAPLDTANKESLGAANDAIRNSLEELHPEIKGINWERGAALEIKKAIDQYLVQKKKGQGESGDVSAALRLKPSKFSSFSVYDLLGTRSFRSKLGILLDKAGRKLTGETPNPVTGVKNPVLEELSPPRSTYEEDLGFLKTNPETVRPMMEKTLGESAKNLSDEALVKLYRAKHKLYLNEMPASAIDDLVNRGLISKAAGEKAKATKSGTINAAMTEKIRKTGGL